MRNFKFTLRHDHGTANVTVQANTFATALKHLCAAESCPETAITNVAITDVLPVLYAKRVPAKFNLFTTELYDESGQLLYVYSAELDQPRKTKKTIVFKNVTYQLKFKN